MVRKGLRLVCALLLICLLPVCALASSMVVDDANLFTSSEISEMERLITDIRDTYQVDVAVVTSSSVLYGDTTDFADTYYENHGYGLGDDRSGLLYLIDMRNRQRWISTAGSMIDYINDRREEGLLDAGETEMQNGEYGASTIALLRQLQSYMKAGREEGSFRYDETTGKRLSGIYNVLTSGEALVAVLSGLGVALALWLTVTARYNLKGSTYRYQLDEHCTRKLTRDDEAFLNQTIVRTPRVQSSGGGGSGFGGGGGSGVHTSSGGMSHGGGGRGF